MQQDDDLSSLVERAKGDPKAFAEIYDLFFDRVYAYARYKVGNTADAEDISEQVFMKALESIDRFQWRGHPFSAWLFRIAHNQVVDHFRANKKRAFAPLDEVAMELSSEIDLEAEVESRIDGEDLRIAIGKLNREQQDVLILKFINGLSNIEVARVLGKSEGAVKSLQHRALINLRKIFARVSHERD